MTSERTTGGSTLESGKKPAIALGVTGSIAAYKSVDLVSRLRRAGVDVHVIMTANAARLVAPLTFMTVSRNQVVESLWDVQRWEPRHIELAERVELFLIAPASANVIGKLACGIADDALSTFGLAHRGPLLVAPAMNPRMWGHPAVRENCRVLNGRGVRFLGPEAGAVVCEGSEEQPGRMSEPETICNSVLASLQMLDNPTAAVSPRRIVVTAGPTREPLDPVRFIANRSSGRMGYALAECALAAGHEVVLISGPAAVPPPLGCGLVRVETAEEMAQAVRREFETADVLLMAAAVADYRPSVKAGQKIKKTENSAAPGYSLSLVPNEDILAELSVVKRDSQTLVGFAAETENLEANAAAKLEKKKLDWLVANDVSRGDVGFESEQNEVILYESSGQREVIPKMNKLAVAARIINRVLA